jgi:hypothetical protein
MSEPTRVAREGVLPCEPARELPSSNLRARILAEARKTPSPTIAVQRSRTIAFAVLGAAASLFLSFLFGFATTRPTSVLMAVAFGGGVVALVTTWLAATRGTSMLGRPIGVLAAIAVLAPIALLASAIVATGFEGNVVFLGGTARQHVGCVVSTLLFALGPFVALAYARRGSDPVHPRALGAALGAAAGVWGGAMIDVHCRVTAVVHLALAHALPIAILALVGVLVGARVFGVRAPDARTN